MPSYIEMPKLSDTMTEGTLVKWRKQKGDKVVSGDILAEVETDKATMEMEAFDDGILAEIYVPDGARPCHRPTSCACFSPRAKPPRPPAPSPRPR